MPVHEADPSEAGSRLDVVLTRLTGFSRAHVTAALRAGGATVNGDAAKPSTLLTEGDRIDYTIAPPAEALGDVRAEAIPLAILFEDEHIIVVEKPAGMVTHPAHGVTEGTLVNALAAHVGTLPGEPMRGGLIHRLDRDTSGLLVVAKTEAALGTLARAMKARYITREYRGIVMGIPRDPRGTITGAIGRDPRQRFRYAVTMDGKPAVTHYSVREELRGASELDFRLETGRTHQIRVHLAALGHPLLNDPVYGRRDPRMTLPGQALHAWRLGFKHPATRERLTFEAEPPPAYRDALALLRA